MEEKAASIGARFICLDSIAMLFRSEYGEDPPTMPERNWKVRQVLAALRHAAEQVNGVVVFTNQQEAGPYEWSKARPWGYQWLKVKQIRLRMRSSKSDGRLIFSRRSGARGLIMNCEVFRGSQGFTDYPLSRSSRSRTPGKKTHCRDSQDVRQAPIKSIKGGT